MVYKQLEGNVLKKKISFLFQFHLAFLLLLPGGGEAVLGPKPALPVGGLVGVPVVRVVLVHLQLVQRLEHLVTELALQLLLRLLLDIIDHLGTVYLN